MGTSNSYAVIIEPDADHLRYSVRLTDPPSIPAAEWALLVGDCVHNARSALDYLAWELAGADPEDRQTQFPIFLTPDGYRTRGRMRISRIGNKKAQTLFELLQPYNTSNPPSRAALAVLNDLDRSDKHHLLLVVAVMHSRGIIDICSVPSSKFTLRVFYATALERDAIVAQNLFEIPAPQMNMTGHITPAIAFGQRFGGQDITTRVLPALETIIRHAR